jgi:hypothetical protein
MPTLYDPVSQTIQGAITLKKQQLAIGTFILLASGAVFAQQSEYQAKIQEDMDGYKAQINSNCGSKGPSMKWVGKLAVNPRESEKPDYNAVSTLCTSALDGMSQTCQNNKPVKTAFGKISSVVCTYGKGTLDFKIKGSEITFTVDPAYTKNNASGQETDLVTKFKKTLDN